MLPCKKFALGVWPFAANWSNHVTDAGPRPVGLRLFVALAPLSQRTGVELA